MAQQAAQLAMAPGQQQQQFAGVPMQQMQQMQQQDPAYNQYYGQY